MTFYYLKACETGTLAAILGQLSFQFLSPQTLFFLIRENGGLISLAPDEIPHDYSPSFLFYDCSLSHRN